jgi:hypothetical protein
MKKNLCWFLMKWNKCLWIKDVRVKKWKKVNDGKKERRIDEDKGDIWMIWIILNEII